MPKTAPRARHHLPPEALGRSQAARLAGSHQVFLKRILGRQAVPKTQESALTKVYGMGRVGLIANIGGNEVESILRLKEVQRVTGLSRTPIYSTPGFPKPVKIGSQASGWVRSEVEAWIAARIADRDRQ
jgi:prophage regulatory protein